MTPRLSFCRQATTDEWDQAVRACSHATFFQTQSWANVWKDLEGLLPMALICEFTDGARLLWPFSQKTSRRGIVRQRLLSAAGTYGGALYGPALTLDHVLASLPALTRGHSLDWRLSPFEPHARQISVVLSPLTHSQPSLWSWRADSTETLSLASLQTIGDILRHASHGCRKQCLKGDRAGLSARSATAKTDWGSFAELYRRSVARWGDRATRIYPERLFTVMRELPPESCRLWLAYHREQLVGGSLNFFHNRHAVEWLAAYDQGAFSLGVRNWLTARMIEHAATSGYSIYDFNPSGALEGTRRFKQTFNTQQHQAPMFVRKTILQRGLERIGR